MDEAITARMNELKNEAHDLIDEVGAAIESGEDHRQLAAGRRVEALTARYQEFSAGVAAADKDQVERVLGRKITDLRRAAAQLTRRSSGQKAERSTDAGHVPFIEQRKPPKSIMPQRAAPTRNSPRFSVGGEVEAWCGKCREMRTHHIVAMVGDQPKQVICDTCRSRHGYRTEPGRNAPKTPAAVGTVSSSASASYSAPVDREAARRREQQRALQQELDAAEAPRTFNPKERYKAGEIIVHPEHGRGKIENVLRGSMLVRFREGLRPLNLA